MNSLIAPVLAIAAAGTLGGCAQTQPMGQGMMMGQMPMMGSPGGAAPQMDKMMAACMEHMQAMSAPREGARPMQPPAR